MGQSMENGWIKLYRKILSSAMYQSLNSKQRDVLIVLLLMANHEGKKWEWNNQIYECQPGEFITSLENIKRNCAKDVSIRNIRTALEKLEKWEFLTNKSTKTGRQIKILKWEVYQKKDEETDKQLTKNRQRTDKELTTNKNNKNVKNYNNIYTDFFKKFWEIYPKRNGKKVGKKETWEYFKDKIKEEDLENLMVATRNYANSKIAKDNYAKDPVRFLKKDYWRDWIEPPEKQEKIVDRYVIPTERDIITQRQKWEKEMEYKPIPDEVKKQLEKLYQK
jgi:hypothetical protein